MNMINVNFNDLKKTNPDFVQANNNKYYLTHSFNKLYNTV